MMRFTLQDEPADWDARCRKRGRKWIREHPSYDRPKDYWTEFEPDLCRAFRHMCAYCVMVVMKADMDHFIPVAHLKKTGKHELAYEWSNFRYAEGVLNQRKHDQLILDPFEVKDDWFKIILPSLQLVLTDRVPKGKRKKAEFTIVRLGLRDDEVVIRYRRKFFEMYCRHKLPLEGLRDFAPQIAQAVERDLGKGKDWRLPGNPSPGRRRSPTGTN
jgi:hypothetical protein